MPADRPLRVAGVAGKPVAIVGATPGRWGTVRSQLALRQLDSFGAWIRQLS
jgi:NAD(P)H-dependent FMN reductase